MRELKGPPVGTACAVFRGQTDPLGPEVLLVRRRNDPFAGSWALPGGFMEPGETVEQTAARELLEETALSCLDLRQLRVYPEGLDRWVLVSAHYGTMAMPSVPVAGDDAAECGWWRVSLLGQVRYSRGETVMGSLAFNHDQVVRDALEALGLAVL
jgi:8-oxo-dGTP diphosphatase